MNNPSTTPATAETAVWQDINSALDPAGHKPTSQAADELRTRLRSHIHALLEPAERYVTGMADNRARDIAEHSIRHARALADDTSTAGDPAVLLRLLAKAAETLLRYPESR